MYSTINGSCLQVVWYHITAWFGLRCRRRIKSYTLGALLLSFCQYPPKLTTLHPIPSYPPFISLSPHPLLHLNMKTFIQWRRGLWKETWTPHREEKEKKPKKKIISSPSSSPPEKRKRAKEMRNDGWVDGSAFVGEKIGKKRSWVCFRFWGIL